MTERDSLAPLTAELDALGALYDARFAGQPRITRNPAELEQMITRVRGVVERLASRSRGADRDALLARAERQLELYERERENVRAARAGGPEALAAHRLQVWATLMQDRYRRRFVGQSRATRDLGLLADLINEADRLRTEMDELLLGGHRADLAEARQAIERDRALYVSERGEIVAARGSGTLEEQSDRLAGLANTQFEIYTQHFAGKSRLSRRPETLQRVIDNLEQVADRMSVLRDSGLRSQANDRNRGIVSERLDTYRKELGEIRGARERTSLDELVGAFGQAANGLFEEYRAHFAGKDRATRDLDLLYRLSDALYDLAAQMDALDQMQGHARNAQNLQIVLDHLRLYAREGSQIVEARKSASGT